MKFAKVNIFKRQVKKIKTKWNRDHTFIPNNHSLYIFLEFLHGYFNFGKREDAKHNNIH